MSFPKRKASCSVPSLQADLALCATLDTDHGLLSALTYLCDQSDAPMRCRVKEMGFVVAKKSQVEDLMRSASKLQGRAQNSYNETEKSELVDVLKNTMDKYKAIGVEMTAADKKKRFESACVSNTNWCYDHHQRRNLEDGMLRIPNKDTYEPYSKAEESWHTYMAGPEACNWAKSVLDALHVDESKYMILKAQRIVSVEWRARTQGHDDDEEPHDDDFF